MFFLIHGLWGSVQTIAALCLGFSICPMQLGRTYSPGMCQHPFIYLTNIYCVCHVPGSHDLLSSYMDYTRKEPAFQKPKNREEDITDSQWMGGFYGCE